jgi:hypothetical protein
MELTTRLEVGAGEGVASKYIGSLSGEAELHRK